MDKLQLPDLTPDWDDVAKSVIKMAVGYIPGIGPGLSELLSYFPSSSQERLIGFIGNLANAINYFNERDKNIVDRLKIDPAFFSFLTEVWEGHRRNHEEQKYSYFGNAIINYPLIQIPYDRKRFFVTLINELSLTHLDVLKRISEHYNYLKSIKELNTLCRILQKGETIGTESIPEVNSLEEEIQLSYILNDLKSRNLLLISDGFKNVSEEMYVVEVRITADNKRAGLPFLRVSDLGNQFLNFIEGQ